MFMRASAADGDIPAATTVPEDELEQLSMENGVAGKAVASSSSAPNNVATIRYTPTADSGDDYTLADATDIAIRLKVVNRQTTGRTAATDSAMCASNLRAATPSGA